MHQVPSSAISTSLLRRCGVSALVLLCFIPNSVTADSNQTVSPIGFVSIHGLNQSPEHFHQVERLLPATPSHLFSHVELSGHRSAEECEQSVENPLQVWRTQVEIALAKNPAPKLVLVGYSLGALLALDAAKHEDRVQGMILFAPPLELRWRVAAIHLLTPFAVFGWSLPSMAPVHSRACPSTSLQQYAASLELQSSSFATELPILIFAAPDDELASFDGIQRWFAAQADPTQQASILVPVETTGRYAAHLITDEENVTKESWLRMKESVHRFVEEIQSRRLN